MSASMQAGERAGGLAGPGISGCVGSGPLRAARRWRSRIDPAGLWVGAAAAAGGGVWGGQCKIKKQAAARAGAPCLIKAWKSQPSNPAHC